MTADGPGADGDVRPWVVAGVGVAGASLLGRAFAAPPGSARFYALSSAVAATWLGGARLARGRARRGSGRTRLVPGRARPGDWQRVVLAPVATGVAAFGVFYGGALVARHVPALDGAINRVFRFADEGSTPLVVLTTLVNGVAEETFFRGAVYSAAGDRHPVAVSSAVYVLATAPTRNPALVLASALMGVVFAAQRRASGGVHGPALAHVTWSSLMLRYIPPLFRTTASRRHERQRRE